MKTFMRLVVMAVLSLGIAAAGVFAVEPALAQSLTLQQAQSQGLVGERQDGYIGVVKDAPGVQTLVNDINLQRRQLYRDIARKNNIPLDTVEKLAADKAIKRAPAGEYVMDATGNWVKK